MYVVTGGAGMIGSAVIYMLNQRGINDILVVDNLDTSIKWKNLVNVQYTDYVNREEFIERIREKNTRMRIEAIIHMGACSNTTEPDGNFLMHNNFHYTRDLFLYAKKNGTRFINASTAATYGNGDHGFGTDLETTKMLQPLNMYGYSKQLFDLWCIRNDCLGELVSLKFFNVYGPNEYHKGDMRSVICKAFAQIQQTGKLQLFKSDNPEYEDGGQLRDFVYVKDCAFLIGWLLDNKHVGGILNVGTGRARTWNSMAKILFNALGKKPSVEYIPVPDNLKGKYQYFTQAEMEWVTTFEFPYSFTSLEQGIQEYVQSYLMTENPYLSSLKNIVF